MRLSSSAPKSRSLHYDPSFVTHADRREVLTWLESLHPIWENRFSTRRPLPAGEEQRRLLRPVYWLGNWQFACLDYYHPPHGILNRCVKAEPFPAVLQRWVDEIERIARAMYKPADMPGRWRLNTCLVNLYGSRVEGDRRIDTARVGEHKDFEPGPVASISLGERALFQFVSGQRGRDARANVVLQQWLDDGSLQIFGGAKWKRELFHRVQRVDRRDQHLFKLNVEGFETRRVNFTFRYVPEPHVIRYSELPAEVALDVQEYMEQLAAHSPFFAEELRPDAKSL